MTTPMIVFGEDWGAHPSSTQHIVRRLARDRKVLWTNSIGLRRPRLTRRDVTRAVRKVMSWGQSASETAAHRTHDDTPRHLHVTSPLAVSWPGSRIAARLNRAMISRHILSLMRRHEMRAPILWTSLPTAVPVVGALGERKVVYYCGDDFGALAGVDHDGVLAMERELVDKADLIIAASDVLAERFPAKKTLLVPHGVDLELFRTPATRAFDLPDGRPIAGFYGSLQSWIDIEMIAAAAQRLPEWHFVLIGDVATDVSALQGLANIHLLGRRSHAALPGYVQHWDVSLLPFRSCPQIDACNPLKLREYLAAGPPIVSTPFPALRPYGHLIGVATGVASFVQAIQEAPARQVETDLRRKAVAAESWDNRARTVAEAMDAL